MATPQCIARREPTKHIQAKTRCSETSPLVNYKWLSWVSSAPARIRCDVAASIAASAERPNAEMGFQLSLPFPIRPLSLLMNLISYNISLERPNQRWSIDRIRQYLTEITRKEKIQFGAKLSPERNYQRLCRSAAIQLIRKGEKEATSFRCVWIYLIKSFGQTFARFNYITNRIRRPWPIRERNKRLARAAHARIWLHIHAHRVRRAPTK